MNVYEFLLLITNRHQEKNVKKDRQEFPCDLCGTDEAVEVPYARLYTNDEPIHICRRCGFVYVKYRRSADEIARSWSEEIFGSNYTARIPAVKARQVYVADFIDVNIGLKGRKLVDIGAGEGQFLEIVKKEYDADIFGIEPSKENCTTIKKAGFGCYNGTIGSYLQSDSKEQYDVATIMWTLENCMSLKEMLGGAYNLLKPGGYLAVATGSRILVPFKKRLQDYYGVNPRDTHCFRFSANTLKGVLATNGFEVKHENRYIDTDYLVMVAQKCPQEKEIPWTGDDFLKVYDFFARWHAESIYY